LCPRTNPPAVRQQSANTTGPLVPLPVNGKLWTGVVGFVPGDVTEVGTVLPCP
jgi:hypothetical protein